MILGQEAFDKLHAEQPNNMLWGDIPGRLVLRIHQFIEEGSILEIGCGDGKNALFLEKLGFDVTGYDYSFEAVKGLYARFARAGQPIRGTYAMRDISIDIPTGKFDALVSNGVLHCLDPKTRVNVYRKIQECIRPGGYMLFSCVTNHTPLPTARMADSAHLVSDDEITAILEGWVLLDREDGLVVETHFPDIGNHDLSTVWIIARKSDS